MPIQTEGDTGYRINAAGRRKEGPKTENGWDQSSFSRSKCQCRFGPSEAEAEGLGGGGGGYGFGESDREIMVCVQTMLRVT